MEVMMRTRDMTFYGRITSFYSAPFTKFMGNLVNTFILYNVSEIVDLSFYREQRWCSGESPRLAPMWLGFDSGLVS